MKTKSIILLLGVCILLNLLTACSRTADPDTLTGEVITNNSTRIMPKNVIQIGEAYEFSTTQADGHFLCAVTGARMVTKQSECPPREWFDPEFEVMLNTGNEQYPYDEWFTEGGAFAHNCRLILVDISVTNVDAQSWLDNGTFTTGCGWFADTDLFYAHDFGKLADLDAIHKQSGVEQYLSYDALGFSKFGEYADDPNTKGYEPSAIHIAPGETVSFTLVYPHSTDIELSSRMLCVSLDTGPENGTFVDLKMGDNEP